MKKKYYTSKNLIGLGLVFHITPANIPTNFVYSLIFGLLTGNSNILKVPSKKFKEIDIICNVLKKIIKKMKFLKIKFQLFNIKTMTLSLKKYHLLVMLELFGEETRQ